MVTTQETIYVLCIVFYFVNPNFQKFRNIWLEPENNKTENITVTHEVNILYWTTPSLTTHCEVPIANIQPEYTFSTYPVPEVQETLQKRDKNDC